MDGLPLDSTLLWLHLHISCCLGLSGRSAWEIEVHLDWLQGLPSRFCSPRQVFINRFPSCSILVLPYPLYLWSTITHSAGEDITIENGVDHCGELSSLFDIYSRLSMVARHRLFQRSNYSVEVIIKTDGVLYLPLEFNAHQAGPPGMQHLFVTNLDPTNDRLCLDILSFQPRWPRQLIASTLHLFTGN